MSAERTLYFVIPGALDSPTGGYAYDRRIMAELRLLGWHVEHVKLGDTFPLCEIADREHAHACFAKFPDGATVLVDGLAFGVLPEVAQAHCARLRLFALVHHPLFMEEGISPPIGEAYRALEQKALNNCTAAITTSRQTATTLREVFNVPVQKAFVVEPGTDLPSEISSRSANGHLKLLCVGSLIPRKGQILLLEALEQLQSYDWELQLVGSLDFDRTYAEDVRKKLEQSGLAKRVSMLGAVNQPQLDILYRCADVFVLPSLYEGYGMAFTEALAHGLPIIASGEGAVRQTLPSDACLYFEARDVEALRHHLQLIFEDPETRMRLAQAARAGARHLPTWTSAAQKLSKILEEPQ
ncbi:glycosyltransferase [Rhodobacteraceae bacterium RKSG542]|uniref:glycosyltransferase family 4 protein n=1 Tax=Pseudovibrio flavus TaxID=2529854 RepID=UPI0012BC9307|nr:glycosyltransferase family 4 protein [Pseudovibrio flavus]MTI17701.1 glycosyltransferase [Pseudovibrio flavus]